MASERKRMEYLSYQGIDLQRTGKKIKECVDRQGIPVKKLQVILNLAYPQPIYRWYRGEILPSVDHLYMLSRLLDIHMEDLIVPFGRDYGKWETKENMPGEERDGNHGKAQGAPEQGQIPYTDIQFV